MPDVIKPFMIGRNVSISIAPVTIAADGTVTAGTSISLVGKAAEASLTFTKTTEDIRPLDGTLENHVPLYQGWRLNVTGLKLQAGTNANPVSDLAFTSDYGRVVIGTPLKTYTFTGTITDFDWPITEGAQRETLTLAPIDIGGPNPVVAAVV